MASLSHKIAANTVAQMIGKGASTFLGVVITILLTRYLGPTGYGTFIFVLVFVTMFGTVADWGLTLITIREASKNPHLEREIIGNVLIIRLVLAVLAAMAAIVAIRLLSYDAQIQTLVSIASLYLVALSLKTSFQIIFNVKLAMQNWAWSEFSANAVTVVLLVWLLASGAGLTEIILAYLAGDFMAAGVAAVLGYKMLPPKLSLVSQHTKNLLLESLPMGTILVVFTIYNRIDTVILSAISGQEAVGLYGAAYRILEVLILGAAYFANSILPLLSRYAHNDRDKLRVLFRKSYVVLLLLGTFVAICTYIFAPLGVAVVAGPKFGGSVVALQILSLVPIVAYFNHLNGYTLIALGKQWYSLAVAIVALVVNVSLNLIFIPLYSYRAAAFITFVTEGLIVVMSLVLIKRELGILPSLGDIPTVVRELIVKRGKIFEENKQSLRT